MCTASWLSRAEGFELFFNRDESLRRGLAEPPRLHALEGVRVLAPIDADAGGTWLGVNEYGLALGLLNAWDARPRNPELRSRGLLVRELLSARSLALAVARLRATELERYPGFTLLLLSPGTPPRALGWDGTRLAEREPAAPLSSSSLDAGRAQEERQRLYQRLVRAAPAREALEEFQRSHEPERGPWSPCMHRADAHTVSATQVRVEPGRVSLRYAAGAPCATAFGAWLELERSA